MKKSGTKQKQKEEGQKTWKTHLAEFWDFVWNGDSFASWMVSIILAFIIIRFIFYPLLGLAVGTQMPIVAVISSSMEHRGEDWTQNPAYCSQGYCLQEEWYIEKGIKPAEFAEFPFVRGFNKGDIMIIVGKNPEKIKVGDVIVFQAGKSYPIIHRVVAIKKDKNGQPVFETKGDNNAAQIVMNDLDETNIPANNVRGVAKLKIPYLGYIKIGASKVIFTLRDAFVSATSN